MINRIEAITHLLLNCDDFSVALNMDEAETIFRHHAKPALNLHLLPQLLQSHIGPVSLGNILDGSFRNIGLKLACDSDNVSLLVTIDTFFRSNDSPSRQFNCIKQLVTETIPCSDWHCEIVKLHARSLPIIEARFIWRRDFFLYE